MAVPEHFDGAELPRLEFLAQRIEVTTDVAKFGEGRSEGARITGYQVGLLREGREVGDNGTKLPDRISVHPCCDRI